MTEMGHKRGRKFTLTDTAKKRHKMESNARCNMYRISIGSEYSRWNELKAALRLKTNAEVAKTLLDA